MKRPNPGHVESLKTLINEGPYYSLMSMSLVDIGVGFSTFKIDVDKKHYHAFNAVHGGVFASIIDTAAYWAVFYSIEDENMGAISVDLKLNYLASTATGELIAKGRLIKLGKTLGYTEAEVINQDGKLMAHGTSTLMILAKMGLPEDFHLPPKFLDENK